MRAEKQKVLFEDDWNPISLPPDLPPVLLVVVDAEEEFDWSGPFTRDRHSVRSMAAQGPMHRIFEKYGIRPTYVVDYPIASQRDGLEPLRDLLKDDACLIGTQLHPWVNPPFDEEISERNSFPGNLAPDLERTKLAVLTRAIEDGLGPTPRIYKAGRYGLGPKTFRTLTELGYQIDISAVPGADLRIHHGPDFRRVAPQPYWIGPAGRLLELPLTRGYVGLLSDSGPRLEGSARVAGGAGIPAARRAFPLGVDRPDHSNPGRSAAGPAHGAGPGDDPARSAYLHALISQPVGGARQHALCPYPAGIADVYAPGRGFLRPLLRRTRRHHQRPAGGARYAPDPGRSRPRRAAGPRQDRASSGASMFIQRLDRVMIPRPTLNSFITRSKPLCAPS